MRKLLVRLKLTINEDKTGRCQIPQQHFDVLGYTFGRCDSPKTGWADIGTRPSRKSIRRVCRTISEVTSRRWLLNPAEEQVATLNRVLVGWGNDFSLGPVSNAYRTPTRTSMQDWGYNDCRCARVTFRGRRHDTSSERRMRKSARPVRRAATRNGTMVRTEAPTLGESRRQTATPRNLWLPRQPPTLPDFRR